MRLMRRASRDGGFTLAELTVVIGLLAVVGVIAVTALFTAFRSTARIADSTDTAAKLQLAAERLARELRVADPIIAGSARAKSVQVRIFRSGRCDRFLYRLERASSSPLRLQLVQYRQGPLTPSPSPGAQVPPPCTTPSPLPTQAPGTPSPSPTVGPPRTVLVDYFDGTLAKIFTYYNSAGVEITEAQLIANTALTTDIREIKLTLRRVRPGKSTLQVITSIKLRNVRLAP